MGPLWTPCKGSVTSPQVFSSAHHCRPGKFEEPTSKCHHKNMFLFLVFLCPFSTKWIISELFLCRRLFTKGGCRCCRAQETQVLSWNNPVPTAGWTYSWALHFTTRIFVSMKTAGCCNFIVPIARREQSQQIIIALKFLSFITDAQSFLKETTGSLVR